MFTVWKNKKSKRVREVPFWILQEKINIKICIIIQMYINEMKGCSIRDISNGKG